MDLMKLGQHQSKPVFTQSVQFDSVIELPCPSSKVFFIVALLLSALVKRFSVSCMQFFFSNTIFYQQKNAIAYHIFEVKFITQNLIRGKFEPHSMCGPMLQNVKLFNGQMVQWFNGSMIKCA